MTLLECLGRSILWRVVSICVQMVDVLVVFRDVPKISSGVEVLKVFKVQIN